MKTQYAIFQNYFGNDYCYWDVTQTELYEVFENPVKAQTKFKELVVKNIKQNLSIILMRDDNKRNVYKTIDDLLKRKFDVSYFDADEDIFDRLTDNDFIELCHLINYEPYKLIEISENDEELALWLNSENQYLIKFHSDEVLIKDNTKKEILINALNHNSPEGSIEELFKQPHLIQSMINAQTTLGYENNKLFIRKQPNDFDKNSFSDLSRINYWLKNKWFEIRQISSDKLQ